MSPAADAPRTPILPRVGHAARLGMSRRERFLVVGHLIVMALALEDEEVVALLAKQFGWGAGMQALAESLIAVVVLAVWGLLTVAWVRCRRGGA